MTPLPRRAASALRRHANLSTVLAGTALFVALGGSSYAAVTVSSANVRDNSLTGRDIRDGGIGSRDVKDRSLRRADFRRGELPVAGTNGAPGERGPAGE